MSSLFERLATAPDGAAPASPARLIAAIKRHLEALLNSRQGCSQSSPALGLRDFNGHHPGETDALGQLTTDIRQAIDQFEPRLRLMALHASRPTEAPLELHCQLHCQLTMASRTEWLDIDLLVNGHSRYTRVR